MTGADPSTSTAPGADRPAGRWDAVALRRGAAVCLALAVPFTVVARLLLDQDRTSGWSLLLALGSFAGFVLGAGVAAWHQRRGTPLSHGIVTASGVYVAAQAVFSVARLARGEDVNLVRILISLTLTGAAGAVGGLLGSFLQRQGVHPQR